MSANDVKTRSINVDYTVHSFMQIDVPEDASNATIWDLARDAVQKEIGPMDEFTVVDFYDVNDQVMESYA